MENTCRSLCKVSIVFTVSDFNQLRLYKTLIKPTLCYESVTWTLTQMSEQMLNTFERKILRRIYGPTHEGGSWHHRWNN